MALPPVRRSLSTNSSVEYFRKVRASSARAEKTCVTVGSPKALGSDTKVVEKSFPPLERVSEYFT